MYLFTWACQFLPYVTLLIVRQADKHTCSSMQHTIYAIIRAYTCMHLSADSPVVVEYVLGAVMRACAWCKFGCWPERMPWSNARFASAERCSLLGGGGDGDKWLKTTSLLSENKNKNHYIHNFVYFVLICRKQRRKLRCFLRLHFQGFCVPLISLVVGRRQF